MNAYVPPSVNFYVVCFFVVFLFVWLCTFWPASIAVLTRTLRSENTHHRPMSNPYYWFISDPLFITIPSQSYNITKKKKSSNVGILQKRYSRHTLWSCLTRCINMKWILLALLTIQSGQDSVHRRTHGRTDPHVAPWVWISFYVCGYRFMCCYTIMMTSSNGNIFRVTGHLCGEFTGHWWIPHTKASDAEPWCFLWSAPK